MDEEEIIKKSIRILSLDTLIKLYSEYLEDPNFSLNEEEKTLASNIIQKAQEMLEEETKDLDANPPSLDKTMKRPKWKRDQ